MSWSAEELDVLKQRADEGLSAAEIAEFLPLRSRNAVIGMLRRGAGKYGQLRSAKPGRKATPKVEAPRLKPMPVRDLVGTRAAAKTVINHHPIAVELHVGGPLAPATTVPPLSPVEILFTSPPCVEFSQPLKVVPPVANLPATVPTTFLAAMNAERCLFFACAWDAPDGPDMTVCGAERAAEPLGTRYCRRHQLRQAQGVAA